MIFRYPAYAPLPKITVPLAYTLHTTQSLKPRLLPFGYEICVCPFFTETVVVELTRDLSFLVEELVDVAGHLVVELEDGPESLGFAFAFDGFVLD